MEKNENKINNYRLKNKIGKGGFGTVYKALDLKTNENVAIKIIPFNIEDRDSIENEIYLMRHIDSRNSIKLIDNFMDENNYYIVMELCDDNLQNYVKNKGKLKIEEIQKILVQLNDVLRFMKKLNINHRDIKPDNILIKYINQNEFIIKLSDYGIGNELLSKNYFTSNEGTTIFKAPEVENNKYDYKADLYSIGIVLYYLYFGEYPINSINNNYENYDFGNLINNLIEKDPNKRLDWNSYINHPFIINYFKKNLNLFVLNDDKYELSEICVKKKLYIGQLLKGTNIFEGKGISYQINGNKLYEGEYKSGVAHGKGILYLENGNKAYEGEWKKGYMHGKGIEYYENGNKAYEGDLKKDEKDGKGIEYCENGNKAYEGDFKKNERDGKGIIYRRNGDKSYEGEFKKNKMHGKGIEYYENGNKVYEGEFKENFPHGRGIVYFFNGKKFYEGEMKEGISHGKGIEYYENGNKKHEGYFKEGKRDGRGISYYKNGNKFYEGEFKEDLFHGKGIFYDENGNKIYEGLWINNTIVN